MYFSGTYCSQSLGGSHVSDSKKPGARDISDLKARLGLKKGAGGTIPPPTGQPAQRRTSMTGSIPPPPGVQPPPGMAPPQPAEPPIPDASMDPFGAMNAMAARGTQQAVAQPEFIIVNDGKPVEQVASSGKMGRILKVALPAVAMLLVGYIVGGMMRANQAYNKTVDDAAFLLEDFKAVGRGLQELQDTLYGARGKDDRFKPNDKDLTTALAGLVKAADGAQAKLRKPETGVLFKANISLMAPETSAKIFDFYQKMGELSDLVTEHQRLASRDSAKAVDKKPLGAYAIVLRAPDAQGGQDVPPYAELVELGAPVCADGKLSQQGCAGIPDKIQVRSDPTTAFSASPTMTVAKNKAGLGGDVVLQLGPTPVAQAFMVGAEAFVDTVGYLKRIDRIAELAKELGEQRAEIEKLLTAEKNRSKRFAL